MMKAARGSAAIVRSGALACAVAAFVSLAAGRPASARWWQCVSYPDITDEFAKSTAVFTGRVLEVQDLGNRDAGPHSVTSIATLEVDRYWKGSLTRRVRVGGADMEWAQGERYVVFASGDPLVTAGCWRTRQRRDAADTLRWLSNKRSQTAAAARP